MAASTRTAHGETSEAMFLTSGFVYDNAEQAEATFTGAVEPLSIFALRQPHHRRAGTPPGFAGRRRGLPRHRHRHGRGARRAALPPARRRPRGCQPRTVRQLPLDRHQRCCRATASTSNSSTPPICDAWRDGPVPPDAPWCCSKHPPTRCCEIVDLRRGRRPGARGRRAGGGGQRVRHAAAATAARASAPISWSTRPPSISTGRAACWAAPCSAREQWIEETLQPFVRNTGPALSPFNAWVLLKGLETLAMRVEAACAAPPLLADALAVASRRAPRLVSRPRRPPATRAGHAPDDAAAARW